jgi:BlaI family penicillinase repressor
MAKRPDPSKGEMEVARIVWGLGEATVGQVFEAFPKERQLDYTTVQTYLRRLEAKGYLHTRRDRRTKLYSAKVPPSQVIRQMVADLTDRLFGGETLPLLRHLIQDRGISADEMKELRALLNRLEGEQDEPH